jgi:hypothetical protein
MYVWGLCMLVAPGFCARVVCASFGLGAFGSLSLLSMLTIHSVCYPRPCRLEPVNRTFHKGVRAVLKACHMPLGLWG